MPNALLEALATGLTAVFTASSDIACILDKSGGGIMVPRGDADAMSHAVISLIDDPSRADILGATGKHIVGERFSVVRMVSATQDLYLRLLDEKGLWNVPPATKT